MSVPYLSPGWAAGLTAAANADPEFVAALKGTIASMTGKVRTTGNMGKVMALGPAMKRLAAVGDAIGVEY